MTKTITEKDLTYNEIKTIKKIIEKESLDFYSLMIIFRGEEYKARMKQERGSSEGNLYDFPPFRNLLNVFRDKESKISDVTKAKEGFKKEVIESINFQECVIEELLSGGNPVIDISVKSSFYYDGKDESFQKIKDMMVGSGRAKSVISAISESFRNDREPYISFVLHDDSTLYMTPGDSLVVNPCLWEVEIVNYLDKNGKKIDSEWNKGRISSGYYGVNYNDIDRNISVYDRELYFNLDKIVKNNDKTITKKDLTLEERLLINSIFWKYEIN